MLNWEKAGKILKERGFDKATYYRPLRIAVFMLETEGALKEIVRLGLTQRYAEAIADIWKPRAEGADRNKKREVKERLPNLLDIIAKDVQNLKLKNSPQPPTANYDTLRRHFEILEEKFTNVKSKKGKEAVRDSNPYLTVSIKSSLREGKRFQVDAKVASSVETSWGNWIQNVLPMFNNSIEMVGAGGFDYVLNAVAYDIKSGPNVANKDIVQESRTKRKTIRGLSRSEAFKKVINVKDFKVATVYGKLSLARMFMREPTSLIIFGRDTWEELTGDEWNAYKLFLWQIRYKIEKGAAWNKQDLRHAVEHFIASFYDDYNQALSLALNHIEYKLLENTLAK